MADETANRKINALSDALIDQDQARTIIEPYANESGFWFGGGNMMAADDGSLYVAGRYRNRGDARTGVGSIKPLFILLLKTWSSGPGQRKLALPY